MKRDPVAVALENAPAKGEGCESRERCVGEDRKGGQCRVLDWLAEARENRRERAIGYEGPENLRQNRYLIENGGRVDQYRQNQADRLVEVSEDQGQRAKQQSHASGEDNRDDECDGQKEQIERRAEAEKQQDRQQAD